MNITLTKHEKIVRLRLPIKDSVHGVTPTSINSKKEHSFQTKSSEWMKKYTSQHFDLYLEMARHTGVPLRILILPASHRNHRKTKDISFDLYPASYSLISQGTLKAFQTCNGYLNHFPALLSFPGFLNALNPS